MPELKSVPDLRFPFRLADAFFITLELGRKPDMPQPLELKLGVEARVVTDRFPDRIEVGLKVTALDEDPPLRVFVEIVGLFDHVPKQPSPDPSIVEKFVNERALYILWSYIEQTIRQTTTMMGIPPLKIKNPYYFAAEASPKPRVRKKRSKDPLP
jgi:hypothetical protein